MIFGCGLTVCFFSMLLNSSDPQSWKNDWFSLNLHGDEELNYSHKVRETETGMQVFGSFNKYSTVEADGCKLKRTEDQQKFLAEPDTYYFDKTTYIVVSPKFKQLTASSPRKIIRKLACPYWLFAILLVICLWSSCCETGLLPQEASPVRNSGWLLLTVLAVSSITFVTWMYSQLLPLKYTVDGTVYLSYTEGNPIYETLYTCRTPGYPLLLNVAAYLSPMTHNSLIVIQYGLYFLALSWLLYELYREGLPSVCCLVLLIIFSQYMYTYHNYMLADSPGLSGIILLLAFSAAWCRHMLSGCTCLQLAGWYLAGSLLIFAQLMIKPFPGTIFIPGGMAVLILLFERKLGLAFRHAIGFSLCALILPLLFCGIRYWKTGDFNFASLASVSICANAIILHDPAKTDQLPPAVRKDMESIVADTLKAHPELKWPIDLDSPDFNYVEDYVHYYWDIMYLPGIANGSWLQNKAIRKGKDYDVKLELLCKKMANPLFRCIDRRKLLKLQKLYLRSLGAYLIYPRLTPEQFCQWSPFGKEMIWWTLFIIPMALYVGRWNRKSYKASNRSAYLSKLVILLAVISFLGFAGIFSTLFLVPVNEIRREMIGLFSVFLGSLGIFFYSLWYLVACLLNTIFRRFRSCSAGCAGTASLIPGK